MEKTCCNDCKYAKWEKTKSGKLHPSGDGRCEYPWQLSKLPLSKIFVASPIISGGNINRNKSLVGTCVYYERKSEK